MTKTRKKLGYLAVACIQNKTKWALQLPRDQGAKGINSDIRGTGYPGAKRTGSLTQGLGNWGQGAWDSRDGDLDSV